MNEQQNRLMPYVEHMASKIVAEKEEACIKPVAATSVEILRDIHSDALECMRELHRHGKFTGSNSLNYPMLIKKEP